SARAADAPASTRATRPDTTRPDTTRPSRDRRTEPEKLIGTVEYYNLGPMGLPNSLSLKTGSGSVQVNFPAQSADAIAKAVAEGAQVQVTATPLPEGGERRVFRLVSLTGADDKTVNLAEAEQPKSTHIDGTIKHLNSGPSGQLNGVVLNN